ncbi:DUF4430 domain-containing protein [Ruminococcus sp. FC2018]|uniref:DUF4430 domain-containing protein n=1 Tax=Ruminococcus sp. FC2018 TaxID=1410617 RepID=UPI000490B5CF|nr:DUF4430 domain-containing protein [Ruminococcus sp. FC2018]
MKKLLSMLAAAVLCTACLVSCGDSSSSSDSKSSSTAGASSVSESSSNADAVSAADPSSAAESSSSQDNKQQAVMTIDVADILANYDTLEKGLQSEEFVPKSGKVLDGKSYEITDGMTALDLLNKAAEDNNIKVETKKTEYGTYVSGINHISEGSCGKTSGWMFKVNGTIPDVGADACKLKAGDKVEFFYVCDYNKLYPADTETTTQKAA